MFSRRPYSRGSSRRRTSISHQHQTPAEVEAPGRYGLPRGNGGLYIPWPRPYSQLSHVSQVYGALSEYQGTGQRHKITFTEGAFEDTYRNHMRTLSDTRASAPVALRRVLHSLFNLVTQIAFFAARTDADICRIFLVKALPWRPALAAHPSSSTLSRSRSPTRPVSLSFARHPLLYALISRARCSVLILLWHIFRI